MDCILCCGDIYGNGLAHSLQAACMMFGQLLLKGRLHSQHVALVGLLMVAGVASR